LGVAKNRLEVRRAKGQDGFLTLGVLWRTRGDEASCGVAVAAAMRRRDACLRLVNRRRGAWARRKSQLGGLRSGIHPAEVLNVEKAASDDRNGPANVARPLVASYCQIETYCG
jgi:hypothetical protein